MTKNYYILLLLSLCLENNYSQNLIANPSFSEVVAKKDSNQFYKILAGNLSEVKHWHLPGYINYQSKLNSSVWRLNNLVHFITSRDKDLVIKQNKLTRTSSDQLFENNLGFMYIYMNDFQTGSIIQQQLTNPLHEGSYCFKFKYKYIRQRSQYNGKTTLEFSFSSSNLKEYYIKKRVTVPSALVQITFKDTSNISDSNTPWLQKCYTINLNGNERFLSIGGLTNPRKYSFDWSTYYIDDIELYYMPNEESKCECQILNKDLRLTHNMEFPLNKHISNDTLIMLYPEGFDSGMITPDAKQYLQNIISFMQRYPKVKITFIEHNRYNNLLSNQFFCTPFINYLKFFGITNDRISSLTGLCEDSNSIYCGNSAKYAKIGFMLHE